ncbi:DUF2834 domain-containing protein [Aquabacterium sp.]|uniref:DUF2834 domain-containing protein n=1 Tax=Aquabacterium sp. TaxID=1872578 RepID=UPI003D6D3C84
MTLSPRQKLLCWAYALIALWALLGTWGHNLGYMSLGLVGANLRFWQDTLVNPASMSITVDIALLSLAVWVWMIAEARRLRLRGVWWYVLASLFIAVSVAVPVFLIQRERAKARLGEGRGDPGLLGGDWAGLALLALVVAGYTVRSFGWF